MHLPRDASFHWLFDETGYAHAWAVLSWRGVVLSYTVRNFSQPVLLHLTVGKTATKSAAFPGKRRVWFAGYDDIPPGRSL
jgi:hypothetical protein